MVVAVGAIVTGELAVRGPDALPIAKLREVAPLTRQEIDVVFPRVMAEGVAVNAEITGTDAASTVKTDALNNTRREVVAHNFFNDDP